MEDAMRMIEQWVNRNAQSVATARPRRGVTLIWVAIVLVVLVGFLGLAFDWGYAYYTTQKLQNAADAAALAGAQRVWESHAYARDAAMEFSSENEAGGTAVILDENADNTTTGDIVVGIYDKDTREFSPSEDRTKANAVHVDAKRTDDSPNGPLPLVWGGLFGNSNTKFHRWAIAVADGGPHQADIIALNKTDKQSFYLAGNSVLDLGDGVVQVDSANLTGATFQGSSFTLIAGSVDMVATDYTTRGNPQLDDVYLNTEQPNIDDPYASIPEPVRGTPMVPNKITGIGTFNPGYYTRGLNLNNGDNVFLNPGVYILDNGFTVRGHATLTGYGVMIFIRTGAIDQGTGTADIHLTPPTSGPYAGIQFFQSRSNTNDARFNGDGVLTGSATDDPSTPTDETTAGAGMIYIPKAKVYLNGNGEMTFNGLIADKIEINGFGRVNVTGGVNGNSRAAKVWLAE